MLHAAHLCCCCCCCFHSQGVMALFMVASPLLMPAFLNLGGAPPAGAPTASRTTAGPGSVLVVGPSAHDGHRGYTSDGRYWLAAPTPSPTHNDMPTSPRAGPLVVRNPDVDRTMAPPRQLEGPHATNTPTHDQFATQRYTQPGCLCEVMADLCSRCGFWLVAPSTGCTRQRACCSRWT